jgi:hypothetical protein
MGNVVIATLEIPFVDPDLVGADGFGLQLLLEEGIVIGNDRFLRLYPAVPALLRASVGDIIRLGNHGQTIENESIQFNGSSSATTEFPIAQLLNVQQFGAIFDRDGNTVNTSFTAINGQIEAEREVFGAIVVDYNTTYTRLQYKPEVTGSVTTAISILLGTVLAFFNGSVATFDIQPSAFPDIENFELYALESKTIVQEVNVYEFPPGWPADNTFPGRVVPPDNLPDPDDAWILVRRFHEIGYITPSRSFTSREFFVRNELPFVGNFTFDPVISLTVSSEVPDELLNSQQAQTALANAQEKVTA